MVRRHKRTEHGLEVRTSSQHNRHVRRNHITFEHEVYITEWFASGFQENGHIVLERCSSSLLKLYLSLGWIKAPSNDFDHQWFLECIELLGHDDVVQVFLFDDEAEAELLDESQSLDH